MQLAVTETPPAAGAGEPGSEPRTAVLVHGIMSGARAWERVARFLAARGYRVLAVDLTGHGASPRAPRYTPRGWVDDVVETVTPLLDGRPDLVLGHSLGALIASRVAAHLRPRMAVYVDPAFAFPRGPLGVIYKLAYGLSPRPTRGMLQRLNPKWAAEDVEIELATLRDWDRRTLLAFLDTRPLVPPSHLVAPSLVLLAERSLLVTRRVATRLEELGMTVEVVPGAGHTVFRDEPDRFEELLAAWLDAHSPVRDAVAAS